MKTLEHRLVDTLRSEAEGLPDEEAAHTLVPVKPQRQRFVRPGLAAPAAVVVVMILAAPVIWLSAGRGGGGGSASDTPPTSQPTSAETSSPVVTTTPATVPVFGGLETSVIDGLPRGFDPEQAPPLFSMDASAEETAIAYLDSRHITTGVGASQVVQQGGYTLVQWAWGRLLDESEQERGESGWLLMRPTTRGYEILAATTDGIDLSDLTITDGSLQGTIQGSAGDGLGVDVLDLDETPVASAPNPEGFLPDADYLWGSAAAGDPPLRLDLPVTGPVIVRVNRVGGALLSISEVILGQVGPFIETPFSGDGWQLNVGEEANPPTDSYKVCHSFAPDQDPNEANGFGPSGCVTWPDDATDEIIMDAIPFTTPDGQILLFVDLTAEPFESVSVVLDDGATVDVAPFAMPTSGKQFAVLELSADTAEAEIQLLDNGEVIESKTTTIAPTD